MSARFSFRYKVRMSWGSRLPFDEHEWRFPESSHGLRAAAMQEDLTLRESEWIVLRGDDYETEAVAREAGMEARQILQRAFAALRLGADFGDHHHGELRLAEGFQNELEARVGAPVVADNHYLLTFPSEPRPHVFGASGRGRVDPPTAEAVKALEHPGARIPCSDPEHLAHQLFGASFFVDDSPEARLLLLTAAVEALLDFQPRSDETRDLVQKWRDEVRAAEIDPAERDSILGQLSFLKQESINQGGQRMVAALLADRRYDDLDPDVFFRRAYDLRSKVTHAGRPDRQRVVDVLPHLQDLVGDLLAGQAMLRT